MFTIHIQAASHYPINRKDIKKAVEEVLTKRVKGNAEVSIAIGGDRQMKALNSKYRKIADTTDVLSFPQHDPSQTLAPFVMPPNGTLYLGDIIVSYPQAVAEAAEDQMMVDDKVRQLILHGLDHLMGIHHYELL